MKVSNDFEKKLVENFSNVRENTTWTEFTATEQKILGELIGYLCQRARKINAFIHPDDSLLHSNWNKPSIRMAWDNLDIIEDLGVKIGDRVELRETFSFEPRVAKGTYIGAAMVRNEVYMVINQDNSVGAYLHNPRYYCAEQQDRNNHSYLIIGD